MTPAQKREKEDAARLYADACERLAKMQADPKCPAGKLKIQERVVSVLRRSVG